MEELVGWLGFGGRDIKFSFTIGGREIREHWVYLGKDWTVKYHLGGLEGLLGLGESGK